MTHCNMISSMWAKVLGHYCAFISLWAWKCGASLLSTHDLIWATNKIRLHGDADQALVVMLFLENNHPLWGDVMWHHQSGSFSWKSNLHYVLFLWSHGDSPTIAFISVFYEWNIIHQSSFSFFSDCDSPVICSVMSATDQLWFMVKFHKEEERHVNRLVGWIWQENLFESHFYITILKGAVSILLGYQCSASSTSKSSLNPIF